MVPLGRSHSQQRWMMVSGQTSHLKLFNPRLFQAYWDTIYYYFYVWCGVSQCHRWIDLRTFDHSRVIDVIYTRTFQQVVFGHPLTTKRLFIDTSWKVLVYIYIHIVII